MTPTPAQRASGSLPAPSTWQRLNPARWLGELSETRYWMYLLLVPSLVLIVGVVVYPTLYGVGLSFQTMRLNRPANNGWAGLAQYHRMWTDPIFWLSLRNTAFWVTATTIIEFSLGLIAALALNRNLPGTKVFAVLILLPYFLPNVVAGNIWALLLDSRLGVINDILVHLHILSAYKAWFADPNTAMPAVILIEAWHGFPFFALLLLAGLKGIPTDLYKAATIDGAGRFAQLRLITLGGEVNLARRRFSLETDLRRAIEQDELNLAFQPLIEFETGAVSGFEVLARWTHPDHGVVSPVEFISVAEDSGLIVPFGRWAIDATARAFAGWDAASGGKLPLRLCINISPVQLARDETITQAVMGSGLDGDRLTLELTESSIVADPQRANRVLREFHDFGCKVAMDDFGTGYSSLAYLQKLPIDILKIDQSFVKDMIDNPDSVAIIRAILGLARALNMATTAEGVETAETAQMLGALGCTTGQGYYFAQPLTAADALAYYRARNA